MLDLGSALVREEVVGGYRYALLRMRAMRWGYLFLIARTDDRGVWFPRETYTDRAKAHMAFAKMVGKPLYRSQKESRED